eukprot:7380658-Prymnesium_polylepis.2
MLSHTASGHSHVLTARRPHARQEGCWRARWRRRRRHGDCGRRHGQFYSGQRRAGVCGTSRAGRVLQHGRATPPGGCGMRPLGLMPGRRWRRVGAHEPWGWFRRARAPSSAARGGVRLVAQRREIAALPLVREVTVAVSVASRT